MGSWTESIDPEWNGRKIDLGVDQAYLTIKSNNAQKLWLYSLSEECYKCPYSKIQRISHGKSLAILDIARPLSLKVFDQDFGKYAFDNETALCSFLPDMGEFGIYNLTINEDNSCDFSTEKEPVSIYLPMLLVILIVAAVTVLTKGSIHLWAKYRSTSTASEAAPEESNEAAKKKRLRSLDTFRGMTITLMIFVNSGGGKYWWIDHATWNGLHVADIVFPCFLWIMGVCIPISIKSQLTKGIPKVKICQRILWRSVKLFLIGLCLNSMHGPTLDTLRIMGVLQRFGVAYLVCATLHTFSTKLQNTPPQTSMAKILYDIVVMKLELIFAAILVIIYLGVVLGAKVPGCPRGYMGPGGKHMNAEYPDCIGGITGYIDKKVLGLDHIYQHPTARYTYDSQPFDPEGLFGCLLTVVQVILGMQCGAILLAFPEWKSRITRWLGWTFVLGLLAGILCLFSKEEGWIPVNKNLWSLSYVCATASIAFLLLSICYLLVDVRSIWSGHPFLEAGMNAIIMYVGHSVFHQMLPWHWRIGDMNTHFLQLLECTWNTILWVLIALYLYHKKIFYNL